MMLDGVNVVVPIDVMDDLCGASPAVGQFYRRVENSSDSSSLFYV